MARRSGNSLSMNPRQNVACTRCGSVGKRRWIDDLYRFRMNQIGVILCDKCHRALMQADARAWDWFRESRPMKIRHVAALTVVGWYLMVPPEIESNPEGIRRAQQAGVLATKPEDQFKAAPAQPSQWAVAASFDSAAECEASKTKMKTVASTKASALLPKAWEEDENEAFRLVRERAAVCFSTDDPRLKGK